MTAPDGGPIRVLLVEDDPAYARLVYEHLRARDELVLVATAGSLAEAIEAARAHAPQVVLLDLGLPDSEGSATIAAFHTAHPRIPLVVLSGLGDIQTALEAMRFGAQEYLVKGQAEAQLFPRAAASAIERKRLQELEQLLIGVVSHDLRGPLQTVLLNCDLAVAEAARAGATAPGAARIPRAQAAARRAIGLVNDLLDATRARLGGPLPLDRTPTDLVALCHQATQDVPIRAAPATLQLDAPPTLIAWVDGARIAQVMQNLVGNAVQHGDPTTPVSIWLRAVSAGTTGAACVELGVHNAGAPIPDELRGKLFEPFERAQLPSRHRSIGLGLYIVHEIVKAHRGTIEVESSAAAGTTFRVRLPVTE